LNFKLYSHSTERPAMTRPQNVTSVCFWQKATTQKYDFWFGNFICFSFSLCKKFAFEFCLTLVRFYWQLFNSLKLKFRAENQKVFKQLLEKCLLACLKVSLTSE